MGNTVDGHQIGRVGFALLQLQAAEGGDVEPVLAVEAAGGDAHAAIGADVRLVGLVGDWVVGEAHHPLHRAGEGAALAGREVAAAAALHLVQRQLHGQGSVGVEILGDAGAAGGLVGAGEEGQVAAFGQGLEGGRHQPLHGAGGQFARPGGGGCLAHYGAGVGGLGVDGSAPLHPRCASKGDLGIGFAAVAQSQPQLAAAGQRQQPLFIGRGTGAVHVQQRQLPGEGAAVVHIAIGVGLGCFAVVEPDRFNVSIGKPHNRLAIEAVHHIAEQAPTAAVVEVQIQLNILAF